jgi:hypothetical protein
MANIECEESMISRKPFNTKKFDIHPFAILYCLAADLFKNNLKDVKF